MIRLLLLPTGHPPSFQPRWVRSSTRSYPRFNLPMGSSPGFASTAADLPPKRLVALFRLGFPLASALKALTEPTTVTRRVIMQKARRHSVHPLARGHGAPTACRRMVSGAFNSPRRGSFHRSLTLLDSLSVAREYLALGDGPPRFRPGFT